MKKMTTRERKIRKAIREMVNEAGDRGLTLSELLLSPRCFKIAKLCAEPGITISSEIKEVLSNMKDMETVPYIFKRMSRAELEELLTRTGDGKMKTAKVKTKKTGGYPLAPATRRVLRRRAAKAREEQVVMDNISYTFSPPHNDPFFFNAILKDVTRHIGRIHRKQGLVEKYVPILTYLQSIASGIGEMHAMGERVASNLKELYALARKESRQAHAEWKNFDRRLVKDENVRAAMQARGSKKGKVCPHCGK